MMSSAPKRFADELAHLYVDRFINRSTKYYRKIKNNSKGKAIKSAFVSPGNVNFPFNLHAFCAVRGV